jgi:hypothetical protein
MSADIVAAVGDAGVGAGRVMLSRRSVTLAEVVA